MIRDNSHKVEMVGELKMEHILPYFSHVDIAILELLQEVSQPSRQDRTKLLEAAALQLEESRQKELSRRDRTKLLEAAIQLEEPRQKELSQQDRTTAIQLEDSRQKVLS